MLNKKMYLNLLLSDFWVNQTAIIFNIPAIITQITAVSLCVYDILHYIVKR